MYRPEISLGDATVLIVDDTPTNLAVLGDILREDGYQVFAAPSGEAALRIVERSPPDLILLDVSMPGMDGFETCRRLKVQESTSHIPVIFVTARSDVQDVVRGFQTGAVDYLCKPVQRDEVRARVQTQLRVQALYRMQQEQAEYFRAIVNTMAEALLIVDAAGLIQFINPAGERLFQCSCNDLRRQPLGCLLAPPFDEDYVLFFQAERGRTTGSCDPKEVVARRQNGQPFPVELTLNELYLDKVLFVCLMQDITQRKRNEDRLVQVAKVDPLTGIANRRCFEERLAAEWDRTQRNGVPLSLVIIDVDHFKLYNDHFGHLKGDQCLQAVARTIDGAARRNNDLAARYGGEEFALILPETEGVQGQQIAERLRRMVEELKVEHPVSPHGFVTVSIGLATYNGLAEGERQDLIQAADRGLYAAKNQGRNRLVVETFAPAAAPSAG